MSSVDHDIVRELLQYNESISSEDLVFSRDPSIGNLLQRDPFAFLLACCLDRKMTSENIWRIPEKLRESLGYLDPFRIAQCAEDDIFESLQEIKGKPRFPRQAAKTIISVAGFVSDRFGGDARAIWNETKSWEINRRLQDIYGVGPGIASMVVLLLDKLNEIKLGPDDYAQMDLKPDDHVQRVFYRLGLIQKESEKEAIDAARRLHPEFPGALDAPAWMIGRNWCLSQRPDCESCRLGKLCPRIIETDVSNDPLFVNTREEGKSASSISTSKTPRKRNSRYSRPVAFTFNGKRFPVDTYKELLVRFCEVLNREHPDSFSRVLQLRGAKHPMYSLDRSELDEPIQIPDTQIFVSTRLSKDNIKPRCHQLLDLFGCPEDAFHIEILL